MALTRLDRIGDGTTTVYDVSFDLGYLRQEYVYVYLEGDSFTNQLSYTWINSTQIELNVAPEHGVAFNIRRVVPRDQIVNDYEEGAILREDNLDDSFLQAIMILQEIQDGYIEPDGNFLVESDIDLRGNGLLNCTFVRGLEETTQTNGAVPYVQILRMINDAAVQGTSVIPLRIPRQTGDGTTLKFDSPATAYTPPLTLLVTIDGLKQSADEDYSVDVDGNVVFDEAPPIGCDIDILWYQPVIVSVSDGVGFATTTSDADGVATAFPVAPNVSISNDDQIVSIDGILQEPVTDFTTAAGVLTFNTAPPFGSRVVIRSFKRE